MSWKRESDYAITRPGQSIAKCYLDGATLYVLWHGNDRIGHYEHPDDAKAAADARRSEK